MENELLLNILHIAERLKDTLRHCTTSQGRPESVAEHSWRLALMALLMRSEFPDVDMDRVIAMCLIHDLGEAFTGDIPVFSKTEADRIKEDALLDEWLSAIPGSTGEEMRRLTQEMAAMATPEARLWKALDGFEALIQHNESPLSTWEPNEYQLQMTYAVDRAAYSPYLSSLRERIREDSVEKIRSGK